MRKIFIKFSYSKKKECMWCGKHLSRKKIGRMWTYKSAQLSRKVIFFDHLPQIASVLWKKFYFSTIHHKSLNFSRTWNISERFCRVISGNPLYFHFTVLTKFLTHTVLNRFFFLTQSCHCASTFKGVHMNTHTVQTFTTLIHPYPTMLAFHLFK